MACAAPSEGLSRAAYRDLGGNDTIRDTGIAIHNTVRTFYELLYPILKGIHNGNTKYYHAK